MCPIQKFHFNYNCNASRDRDKNSITITVILAFGESTQIQLAEQLKMKIHDHQQYRGSATIHAHGAHALVTMKWGQVQLEDLTHWHCRFTPQECWSNGGTWGLVCILSDV